MIRRVAVYCGSNVGADPSFAEAARDLATALASRGIGVVYGGGRSGLMGVVADTALAHGVDVVGVMPTHLVRREIAHEGITELHETATMHERKAMMVELADAYVALPGGVGTLEELSEVLSWARIGLHAKPVAVLNTGGFYHHLLEFLDQMVVSGFIRPHEREMVSDHATPEGLVEALCAATAPRPTEDA